MLAEIFMLRLETIRGAYTRRWVPGNLGTPHRVSTDWGSAWISLSSRMNIPAPKKILPK